jgi:hypothetical protein
MTETIATTEPPKLSPGDRLRQFNMKNMARTGRVASVGAPMEDGSANPMAMESDNFIPNTPGVFAPKSAPAASISAVNADAATESQSPVTASSAASGTQPVQQIVASVSPSQRLREQSALADAVPKARREMAAMKTLTRLLEAVFTRPGSTASDGERMAALSTLSNQAFELGTVVARIAGDDAERSRYVRAMAMDAAVGLVCKSWEQGREIDWPSIIEATANTPEIELAANELSQIGYLPVQTAQDASERLSISMHAAFWQVYSLGDAVNGITPRIAAEIVRDCASYLQARQRFVSNNDLHVSWMQGSIRRLSDLVCAEMRARFSNGEAPTKNDIEVVLSTAHSGFEGVENYAQIILETPTNRPEPRPAG